MVRTLIVTLCLMPLTAAAGEFTPPTALTIPMAPGTYNQLVQDEATEDPLLLGVGHGEAA